MKLYYSKGACSMAPHIVVQELELPCEAVRMDFREGVPPELAKANPMGVVPVLVLDDGSALTEAAVVVQYLADLKPEAGLLPAAGTMARYRAQEWLNFIATELHKGFGPLYNDAATDDERARAVKSLEFRFGVTEGKLDGRDTALPTGFSAVDAYLFTILNWTTLRKMDMSRWPALVRYLARVRERPSVVRTMKAEHLIAG